MAADAHEADRQRIEAGRLLFARPWRFVLSAPTIDALPPIDDEEDYGVPFWGREVWAGVVPLRTVVDAPEDDPRLKPGVAAPDYLGRIRIG